MSRRRWTVGYAIAAFVLAGALLSGCGGSTIASGPGSTWMAFFAIYVVPALLVFLWIRRRLRARAERRAAPLAPIVAPQSAANPPGTPAQ